LCRYDTGDTWIQPCGLPGVAPDDCFTSPVADAPGATLSSLYKMHPTLPTHVLAMTMRAACVSEAGVSQIGFTCTVLAVID
jgi:hypothetical protein